MLLASVILFVVLLAAGGAFSIMLIGTTASDIGSLCAQKQAQATNTKNTLKAKLQAIPINGVQPQRVYGLLNDDCIDGDGSANVYAEYQIAASSVTVAHAEVMQALHATSAQPFAIGNIGNYLAAATLGTIVIGGDRTTYDVSYTLQTPLPYNLDSSPSITQCKSNPQLAGCGNDNTFLINTFHMMDQPVSKVTLMVHG